MPFSVQHCNTATFRSHFTILAITNLDVALTTLICRVLLPKFAWAIRQCDCIFVSDQDDALKIGELDCVNGGNFLGMQFIGRAWSKATLIHLSFAFAIFILFLGPIVTP